MSFVFAVKGEGDFTNLALNSCCFALIRKGEKLLMSFGRLEEGGRMSCQGAPLETARDRQVRSRQRSNIASELVTRFDMKMPENDVGVNTTTRGPPLPQGSSHDVHSPKK